MTQTYKYRLPGIPQLCGSVNTIYQQAIHFIRIDTARYTWVTVIRTVTVIALAEQELSLIPDSDRKTIPITVMTEHNADLFLKSSKLSANYETNA